MAPNTGAKRANSAVNTAIDYKVLRNHQGGDDQATWTVYEGQVYDVTEFLSSGIHPGGVVARLCAGRDSTKLVQSYHPGSSLSKVEKLLKNRGVSKGAYVYSKGERDADNTKEKYTSPKFFQVLSERVSAHLAEKKLSRHADGLGILEVVVTLGLYLWTCYYKMHGSIAAALFLGVLTARLGFLMHMGNHAATSKTPFINDCIGYTMDFIGGSSLNWQFDHQISHHIDPNDFEKDNDAAVGNPMVRLHPGNPRKWWHKYQHYTTFVLMSGGFLSWYILDVVNFVQKAVGHSHFNPTTKDWIHLLFFKILWFITHLYVPIAVFGVSVGWTLLCCAIHMTMGAQYMENTFVVNHIQKGLISPLGCHWAVAQVYASCNWQAGSVFYGWMSGGLNHQIEHHLFPSIAHYHYPAIAPIVEKTCKEFDLPYHNFKTFTSCWNAMRMYLKELGEKDHVE